MISLFRKIRQKLLQQNQVTRYLIYALGEIILVVIGILIALQVNNWNENRKNQNTEQVLLKALLQEFESNLEILDQAITLNDSNIARGLKLGELTGPSLPDGIGEKDLSELMVGVFKSEPRFFPNQGTIEEIINTGRLTIFSDLALRKAISAWKADLDLVKNQEEYVVKRRDLAHEFFLKNGNFRRHLDLIEEGLIKVPPSRFPDNDFKFLENQEFESQLFLFLTASENLNQNYYFPLRDKIQSLIQQVKDELNSNPD
ncbi:DUF6090 family protein [Algoriphagus yeomjeoni]|uniref:Uncharacterized protein n=1 Tax=Algoriphagus yeomjeoni TaxID=291403 RepID=A0A327PRC3_9BACT|nr:DUF6090 family protein [Algoriphagus yeomjeoni]RAI94850.1 hypothetical protein LV83_00097 [Algoriphagus yeomjeoni]